MLDSFFFFNNSLITYYNEGILKIFNIINKNLFWKIDISDLINKNDKIINILSFEKSLFLFFTNGSVIEIEFIKWSN